MRTSFVAALANQKAVLGALILRDMRTRFGRTAIGFVVAIAWPLTHLLAMLGVWVAIGRAVPLGTNNVVFFGTGIMPYLLCLYPGRMMMLAIQQNKPMLLFPVVKVIDIILARALLEMITAMCVLLAFCTILYIAGVEFLPNRPDIAIAAIAVTVLYGISVGLISCVILVLFPMWVAIFILIMIAQWITSGALYLPSMMPPWVLDYIVYNPLYHCISWLRTAYYDGYGGSTVDPMYVVQVSLFTLLLGFAAERAVRGKLLMK